MQIADTQNHSERYFLNCPPPQHISLASNAQNVPGVPFAGEYAYLIVYAGDLDKIDDLQVTIRATTTAAQPKLRAEASTHKVESGLAANDYALGDDDSLKEYLVQERLKAS